MTTKRMIRRPIKKPYRAGTLVAIAAALALWVAMPAMQADTASAAGPPSHAASKADKAKQNGKAVGRPSKATGLDRAAEVREKNGSLDRGQKNGNGHNESSAQLIIQAASNSADIIQVSGDNGTNIANIIQENIQLALNIQLDSLDDLPAELDAYLANLLAGSLDLGPYGEVLGVDVAQSSTQEAANAVIIAQFTGDDGTNVVVLYQVNIQISVNVSA